MLRSIINSQSPAGSNPPPGNDLLATLVRAVEQSPAAVVITDPQGNIEYVNPKFEQITGYSSEEVRGKNPRILKSGDLAAEVYAELWRKITQGGEWSGEFHNRRKDGSLFWERAVISGIKNEAGQITHFLAVKEDITERKRAGQEQAVLQAQLTQAQKLESIGRLAAGIAHEINTPIQYIGDNTRFLKDGFERLLKLLGIYKQMQQAVQKENRLPELCAQVEAALREADLEYLVAEIPQALEQSLEGVARVTKIVRAMKDFSHPGSDEKTPADLNHEIESTVTVARNEWKYRADLNLELEPALPSVPLLAGEFNQVILNLVVNAAQAIAEKIGPEGASKGTITIKTRSDGDWVEVRIADTGNGIPAGVREKIFTPFFTTKPAGKGTGQGLALARSVIVDKHGGTISFESEEGAGTTFILRLPLEASSPAQPGESKKPGV